MLDEWEEYQSILKEVEPYQKWVMAQNLRFKKAILGKGGQKNTAPYTKKAPFKSRSGLGPLEEKEQLVPEIKEDLNQEIWDENGKIKPEISEKLLRIARDFYEGLDLPAPVLNITLTGSMANYNWTNKSDLDLHIVIDYSDADDSAELVGKYLMEAKVNWNRSHEIMIKDHEVEVYVQNINEPHHSTGVYSLLDDEWILKPERAEFEVSEDAIKQKFDVLRETIKMIGKLQQEEKYEEAYGDSDRLKGKLRKYRQSGLEHGGEFSVENLVFKALRNDGELETLSNLKRDAYDGMMSISEAQRKR
jgi:hypothetical protein